MSDGGYKRIMDLPPEKLAEVHNMLITKNSCLEVAQHIQNVWGLYKDEVSADSFSKQLRRYKNKYLLPQLSLLNREAAGEDIKKAKKQFNEKIDVMAELTELVLVHKARIYKVLEREETMPLLLNSVRYEIKELASMLKMLADLQLETGVLKRAPRQVAGSLQLLTQGEDDARAALEANVQSQAQLRQMVDEFFKGLEPLTGPLSDSVQ